MLSSSRTFGSRQSLWPAKFVLLSVATCPASAVAHVYLLWSSCTDPSCESFSHMIPVFTSVTVPSPWSTYARGAPFRSSPSWPVPAHGMTFPLLSQHVVCPVAGSGQAQAPRGGRSMTKPSRHAASVLIFDSRAQSENDDAHGDACVAASVCVASEPGLSRRPEVPGRRSRQHDPDSTPGEISSR